MTNFDKICNDAGFGDLKVKNRKGDIPLKRQAVWCKMYMDFGNYRQIGIQSGRFSRNGNTRSQEIFGFNKHWG